MTAPLPPADRAPAPHETATRRIAAFVAPFALFALLTTIETRGWLGLSYEAVYTLKTALVAGTLWWFRRYYPHLSTTGLALAFAAGVAGCAVWVLLARLQAAIPAIQEFLMAILPGTRAGYDPFAEGGLTASRMAFVAVRLIGLACVVPIMEEIFWRGFLARYLVDEDFCAVPQGKFTLASFLIVTIAFAAVHPEILAAVAWCVLANVVYWKTANLWACVLTHAVTNGLLGVYILATGNWKLW